MDLAEEDPLLLFTGGRADACLGEWKNERLQVIIRLSDGRLILESGKKELVLTEVNANEWSVADAATPDAPVYLCRVLGFGRDTRLTLEPPKHKGGNFKATLRRVEHLGLPEVEPPAAITDGNSGGHQEPPRDRGEDRGHGDARGGDARGGDARGGDTRGNWERSRGGGDRAGSRSASRDSPRGGRRRGGAGGGRGRSQSPRRSRSPCRRRSPRKDGGADEIVTTIFVSGLPGDAREEEVRQDCEWVGPVVRVVLMRRGSERNAFVRFATLPDARRCMDKICDSDMQVCQTRVKAEMARRNTN